MALDGPGRHGWRSVLVDRLGRLPPHRHQLLEVRRLVDAVLERWEGVLLFYWGMPEAVEGFGSTNQDVRRLRSPCSFRGRVDEIQIPQNIGVFCLW
jgi:hypothetical protein